MTHGVSCVPFPMHAPPPRDGLADVFVSCGHAGTFTHASTGAQLNGDGVRAEPYPDETTTL